MQGAKITLEGRTDRVGWVQGPSGSGGLLLPPLIHPPDPPTWSSAGAHPARTQVAPWRRSGTLRVRGASWVRHVSASAAPAHRPDCTRPIAWSCFPVGRRHCERELLLCGVGANDIAGARAPAGRRPGHQRLTEGLHVAVQRVQRAQGGWSGIRAPTRSYRGQRLEAAGWRRGGGGVAGAAWGPAHQAGRARLCRSARCSRLALVARLAETSPPERGDLLPHHTPTLGTRRGRVRREHQPPPSRAGLVGGRGPLPNLGGVGRAQRPGFRGAATEKHGDVLRGRCGASFDLTAGHTTSRLISTRSRVTGP